MARAGIGDDDVVVAYDDADRRRGRPPGVDAARDRPRGGPARRRACGRTTRARQGSTEPARRTFTPCPWPSAALAPLDDVDRPGLGPARRPLGRALRRRTRPAGPAAGPPAGRPQPAVPRATWTPTASCCPTTCCAGGSTTSASTARARGRLLRLRRHRLPHAAGARAPGPAAPGGSTPAPGRSGRPTPTGRWSWPGPLRRCGQNAATCSAVMPCSPSATCQTRTSLPAGAGLLVHPHPALDRVTGAADDVRVAGHVDGEDRLAEEGVEPGRALVARAS